MTRRLLIFTLSILVILGTALSQELIIFNGQPLSELNLKAGGWGSGTLAESKDMVYRGTFSLKLISMNYYEGGRLDFLTPLDLSSYLKNPYAFLRFRIITATPPVATFPGAGGFAPGGMAGMPGGFPGMGGVAPGMPGGGLITPGGAPGMPGGGAPGMPSWTGAVTTYQLKSFRIVLFCEDGLLVSENFPFELQTVMGERWYSIAIPFNTFRGKGNGIVKRMLICTNSPQTVYIGQISVVVDNTPITVTVPTKSMTARVNTLIRFFAVGKAGLSSLRYTWDFDDSNGIQEESIGQVVFHSFSKPGTYNVTVTVSDLAGVKKPAQEKIKVEVLM
ncbi:PKD domain-containing protein [bacterium]|nr:PKD domain-containing protein [bacterium]